MKKMWVFMWALCLLFSGCERSPKLGICLRSADNEITTQLNYHVEQALKSNRCRVTCKNAANDQARQNQQVTSLLKEGCDLLVVEPVMTAEAEGIAQLAREVGVPVIFLNYAPPEEVLQKYDQICYIGSDLTSPGKLLCEQLKKYDHARYVILSGPEQHMDGACWAKQCQTLRPENCLAVEHTDWSKESGKRIAGRYFSRKKDGVNIFVCLGDSLMLGTLEAVKETQSQAQVIGVGGQKLVLTKLAEGALSAVVCPDVFSLSGAVSAAAQDFLSGGVPQKQVLIPFVAVTKDNVQDYLK